MRRADPLIVGGGPAGAAAAIYLLRAGARPVVIERQAVTGDALCGGFLSWRTLEALDALGLSRGRLGGHDVRTLRVFAGRRHHELALPAPGMGLSRRRLDGLLLAEAERLGAAVRRGVAARHYADGRLQLDGGETLESDSLFLATGKHDLRGLARPREAAGRDPLLGLRLRLPVSKRLADILNGHIEMHLFGGGYLGIVLHEDGSANFCMAARKSRLAKAQGSPAALLVQLAQDSAPLGERLAVMPAAPRIDAIGHLPYGWRGKAVQPGLFRLGDQAGVIASLAGEGVGIALASAAGAVRHWRDGGGEASPAYQCAFARQLRRPLAVAQLIAAVGCDPGPGALPIALITAVPGAARLIAGATRI